MELSAIIMVVAVAVLVEMAQLVQLLGLQAHPASLSSKNFID